MKNILFTGLKAITLVWFCYHFLMTILHVMPLNPIKVQMKPVLDASMGSFFSQNWSLFAPNPVSQDYIMLVQPLTNNEQASVTTAGWYNLSSPLWAHFQQNRFSAYDRLARSQSSALRSTLTGDHNLKHYFDACQKGDTASCTVYKKILSSVREEQIKKISRIGSAFCNDIEKFDDDYKYMAIRIRIVTFQPWSKRHVQDSSYSDLDLGIHPIDKTVAPFGLFN